MVDPSRPQSGPEQSKHCDEGDSVVVVVVGVVQEVAMVVVRIVVVVTDRDT